MDNVRNKIRDYQAQYRKNQVEAFRSLIRQQLLNNTIEKQEISALNIATNQLINKSDIDGLYDLLYRKRINNGISSASLDPPTLDLLLQFLFQNLRRLESLLLLESLIGLHYESIFQDQNRQSRASQIVRILMELTDSLIQEYKNSGKDRNLWKLLNSTIFCLKNIVYSQPIMKDQNTNFNEVMRPEYIIKFWFKWFDVLHDNLMYMHSMVAINSEVQLSKLLEIRTYLNMDPRPMLLLLGQCDPATARYKALSWPSLMLVDSFLPCIQNTATLSQLVEPFLQVSKMVYSYTQKKSALQHFRINTFHQISLTILDIFKKLQKQYLNKTICQSMTESSYWIFLTCVLNSETYVIRAAMFEIIRVAFNNLMACRGPLEQYLSQSLVGQLGVGLQSTNIQIILSSLKIYIMVVEYCICQQESAKYIIRWIQQFDIDYGLSNLVHSDHIQIKNYALILKEKKHDLINQSKQENINEL